VQLEQGLEVRDRPGLSAPHPGALVAADAHAPTIRACFALRSIARYTAEPWRGVQGK
jgi:hypothetical protein